MIGEANTLYVYTDASKEDGVLIPNFKIGDGKSYLIDAPFITQTVLDQLNDHINDHVIHVSAEDRERWDNKVRTYRSQADGENLVFTTD